MIVAVLTGLSIIVLAFGMRRDYRALRLKLKEYGK